jgi:hypothetical protein
MGLFGDNDVAEIPDNPFYVAPGTYEAVLTEAKVQETRDKSGVGLSFKWVIEDEDSEYKGQNVSDWNNIYPDITQDEMTAKIKAAMSRTKQRLTQMGIAEEDMNELDGSNPEALSDLIGLHATITVKETSDKNDPDIKYTNLTKVEVAA